MPQTLPPLASLRFFEAAGRHQSFKQAAAELNVTPSAVSHGIVSLEQALGVALFTRAPRGLTLTPAGAQYLGYIAEAFALIAAGTQQLPRADAARRIAVSCAPTLAARWLLPRLPAFRRDWPQLDVTIDTSQRQVGLAADGFDFAIRMSRAAAAEAHWTRLFGETLIPVCSPAYRDTLLDAHGRPDLRRATLIHVEPASEDWQAWLDAGAVPGIDASGGLRFDTIQLAFDAASAGLGVALGRRPLVDRDLDSGALVAVGPPGLAAQTAYWLVHTPDVAQQPGLLAFKQWLVHEAAQWPGAPLAGVAP
jgi:DNA-binding transcriptional LysR family regulator